MYLRSIAAFFEERLKFMLPNWKFRASGILILIEIFRTISDVWLRWHDMKFTLFHIVPLLLARHGPYRKEIRMANNIKITFRS